jgi:carbonic anhydrase
MYEIVWQYDETELHEELKPADAAEARRVLAEGNREIARLFTPHDSHGETRRHTVRISSKDLGLGGKPGQAPKQEPFAAFLGCADARVPVELIFGQQANNLFVVRVAGNTLGEECLGSLDYAVEHLSTVRLLGVLGHTGCGAVAAAVDAYLVPEGYLGVAANFPLQAIVAGIMAPVHAAAFTLTAMHGGSVTIRPGYRQALIDLAVILNSALSAAVLVHTFHNSLGDKLQVYFGVYDLRLRTVGLPAVDTPGDWEAGLFDPPTDQTGFRNLGRRMATSRYIQELLEQQPLLAH